MSGDIKWTRLDEPEFLWGPRAYNAKAGTNGYPRLDMTLAKRVGNPDKASAVIRVIEHGDGEIEYEYDCLCGPCHLLSEGGDEEIERVVDFNAYGKPMPGTYWVTMRVEEYGGYFEPKDYDAFLEIAE